jgi:hypothetical protein
MNAFLVLGLVASAAAQDSAFHKGVIDAGMYKVYQRDRALGTESFEFDSRGDSTAIFSRVNQVLPGPDGDLPIVKAAQLVVGAFDYDLRSYKSTIKAKGKDVTRGLVVEDTALTAYRESSTTGGYGDRFARPAGRFFVVDAQVFVLFDVMCRSLAGSSFKQRKVSIILLRDEQDQMTAINVTDMGADTLRWAARPVVARHLRFSDSYATFHAWIGPQGYMLRLVQDETGLRVEREPSPAVKRRAEPTPR